EPTAHLMPDGESFFSYPPMPDTLRSTVRELDKIGRLNAEVTFFRLGDDPGLKQFLEAMARRVDGKVVAPDARDLGAAVVNEFLHSRQPHFPTGYLPHRGKQRKGKKKHAGKQYGYWPNGSSDLSSATRTSPAAKRGRSLTSTSSASSSASVGKSIC